jgi:photosystem II stability/assembly factor-like uncharacterized protein
LDEPENLRCAGKEAICPIWTTLGENGQGIGENGEARAHNVGSAAERAATLRPIRPHHALEATKIMKRKSPEEAPEPRASSLELDALNAMLDSSVVPERESTKKKVKPGATVTGSGTKTALVISILLLLAPASSRAQIAFEVINETAAYSVIRDASGDLLVGLNGGLARSTDDGATLAPLVLTYPDGRSVTELIDLGNGEVYAISFRGDVDLRRDGTWTRVRESTAPPLTFGGSMNDADAAAQGTVVIAADTALHVSTDWGATWTNRYTSIGTTDIRLRAVSVDDDGAILVGALDGVFRSADGGVSWSLFDSRVSYALYTLADGSILSSSETSVFATYDQGTSWSEIDYAFENGTGLDRLTELDDGTLITTERTSLRRSTDSGRTWKTLASWSETRHGAALLDTNGQVYLATTSGLLRSIETVGVGTEARLDLPLELESLDVYPNPIQSSGWFGFSLSRAATARIEVYNLMGQRVQVTPSRELSPGGHDIGADFGNLPAGAYMARLIVDGQAHSTTTVLRVR